MRVGAGDTSERQNVLNSEVDVVPYFFQATFYTAFFLMMPQARVHLHRSTMFATRKLIYFNIFNFHSD